MGRAIFGMPPARGELFRHVAALKTRRSERERPVNFEVQHALTTLDSRTPNFFVAEAFSKGDLTAKRRAIDALKGLAGSSTTKQLKAKLRLY